MSNLSRTALPAQPLRLHSVQACMQQRPLHRGDRCQRCAAATAAAPASAAQRDYRERKPQDVRVLVVGPTGYIGRFVVHELIRRGYDVAAFARPKSGIGGKASQQDVEEVSCPSWLTLVQP